MPTTDIELQCVGNAVNLGALCQVQRFEFLENEATKRGAIVSHFLGVKQHRREKRVNFVTYECEEGVLYHYRRYVCVKPQTYEEKIFKIVDGEFLIAGQGEGNQSQLQLTDPFEKQCATKGIYSIFSTNNRERAIQHINCTEPLPTHQTIYEINTKL